jgi:hypothetical protein
MRRQSIREALENGNHRFKNSIDLIPTHREVCVSALLFAFPSPARFATCAFRGDASPLRPPRKQENSADDAERS